MRLIYRVVSELFLIISPLIIIYRILKGKENFFRSTPDPFNNKALLAVPD